MCSGPPLLLREEGQNMECGKQRRPISALEGLPALHDRQEHRLSSREEQEGSLQGSQGKQEA